MTRHYLKAEIMIKTDSELDVENLRLLISQAVRKCCSEGDTFVILDSYHKRDD